MEENGQLLGLAGRVVAVLLVLSSCTVADTIGFRALESRTPESAVAVVERSVAEAPLLVDTTGAQLSDEHAAVVQAVYRALAAGDLDALGELYTGDDWAGQAATLADEPARRSVLDALHTPPANLGEGYLYPGFSAEPTTDYQGYQTAFFLDYDPLGTGGGSLSWRGVATLPEAPPA